MQNSVSRLRELWEKTSRSNQVLLIALVVSVMIAGIGFAYWASTPDYVTLVSNTSQSDMAGIVQLMKEKKVLYRINPETNAIEVPASQRAELQMQLSKAGLLNSGSLGYGLLDKAPFGQTSAMEQETIRRAKEGNTAQSIQSLEQVASATVTFAAGDDSPFLDAEKRGPSASVLVHLKPGQQLDKGNIRAIVNLVARGYPGLKPQNISIVDGESNPLWDGSQQEAATVGAEERQTQERAYKDSVAREIQQMVKAAVGPNKSAVVVRAELNFDKQSETRHDVTPGAPTAVQTHEESLKGDGNVNGASTPPPGTAANANGPANVPTYQGRDAQVRSGSYTNTESTKTMANGTAEVTTVKAPGEVKSLAVSVLLDKSVSAETVTALTNSIQNYIGANPADAASKARVTVQTVTFDKTADEQEKKRTQDMVSSERMSKMISYGVPVALMLVMLFLLARSLKPRLTPAQMALLSGNQPQLAAAGMGGVGGQLDMMVGEGDPSGMRVGDALSGGSQVLALAPEEQVHTYEVIAEAFDSNLESILHLAKSKPETVAVLIKSWTTEEKAGR